MKALAIRMEEEQHARLTILSKLSEVSVTDTIRTAIDEYLAKLAADPELSAKAESLTAVIDREAAEQRAAIAGLFGDGTKAPARSTSRSKNTGA